jgi:tetratricopeptide (TPR) repeat protein
MIGAIALLVLGVVDPCAPVKVEASADPESAAAYRQVADAERARGAQETAILAYRSAAERDPADQASRQALSDLCAGGTNEGEDRFQEGLRLMDAGDLRGAIAAFHDARASGPNPSAALLEGVCHYQLHEDREAVPLLRQAESAPVHRDAARLYRGLVALRSSDAREAAALLETAAANPGVGLIASDLARLARRDGRLVLSFLADSGWDSNVALLPNGAPSTSQSADGGASLSGMGLFRPSGDNGPYLRAIGRYHWQAQLGAYDYGGASGAVGWQLAGAGRRLLGEYAYDYQTLGGSGFLSAHRLLASGWLPAGPLTLAATYFVRFESYLSIWSPFSGTVHRIEGRSSLALGAARLGLAYRVTRDGTDRSDLSWLEHGPRANLQVALSRRARFGLEGALSFRAYDAPAAGALASRADTYLDGVALFEYDLADRWTVRASLEARDALSNDPAFAYARIVPTVGLAYVLGL